MLSYTKPPIKVIEYKNKKIASFVSDNESNIDLKTVQSFGEEWSKFNAFSEKELQVAGAEYFDIVDDYMLKDAVVLDLGCGTGRWSRFIAHKVKFIEAVDPSKAIFSAIDFNEDIQNLRVTHASIDSLPFEDESFDFVMSLGVLHHIPDTPKALRDLVKKLKKGGYCLIYLYYSLENRNLLYRSVFFLSNLLRLVISRMPSALKKFSCDVVALIGYMPFVLLARIVKQLFPTKKYFEAIPLFYYVNKPFNLVRNDALDRFGTPLEQRFSKKEVISMMESAGLSNIKVSEKMPCWHAVGQKLH
ncbi:MAG: class I SAM-dependent methyltransferase [Flammeovirgaceae bacterium]|nr:class I SAM-dependent methyltransferase [Flammeovirgaceae bacterium]MDW8287144.1 class I SAM-dependent methyltransferase [Flammeovirgaceae bacterium]